MTNPGRLDLHQHFTGARPLDVDLLDGERRSRLMRDCGSRFHGIGTSWDNVEEPQLRAGSSVSNRTGLCPKWSESRPGVASAKPRSRRIRRPSSIDRLLNPEGTMRTATAVMSIAAMLALAGCGATQTAQQAEPRAFVVYFQTGSAELTPEGRQIVGEIATAARNAERPEITVEGVADRTSTDRDLTARRTAAVESALRTDGVTDAMVTLRSPDPADGQGIAARRVQV